MAMFTSKTYTNLRKVYCLVVCVKTLQDYCFQVLKVAFKVTLVRGDFATEFN